MSFCSRSSKAIVLIKCCITRTIGQKILDQLEIAKFTRDTTHDGKQTHLDLFVEETRVFDKVPNEFEIPIFHREHNRLIMNHLGVQSRQEREATQYIFIVCTCAKCTDEKKGHVVLLTVFNDFQLRQVQGHVERPP